MRSRVIPEPELPVDVAVQRLAQAVQRVQKERMASRHPVFGKLDHTQWTRFHCRHAELHFSFLEPVQTHDADPAQPDGRSR